MSDLIRRKSIKNLLCDLNIDNISVNDKHILEYIGELPRVDAVPVVRCKECKHSDLPSVMTMKYGKPGTLTCCNRYSPCNHRNVNKNDFCSYGEGEKND